MSFFSCLGGPKNEEVSQDWGIPIVCGEKSTARLGCTRAGRDVLELGRLKVLTLHILSMTLKIYAKYPKDLETGKEKGIYEVIIILKEKLKNTMN